jgi:branched-chain amino acid transport system permease protein
LPVLDPLILANAVVNGLLSGAVYALVALGLTVIYGVLHIINFAHGALLMAALYAAFFLFTLAGINPYWGLAILVPAFFAGGYALQRFVIGIAPPGKDQFSLLVTLGLALILENLALFFFRSDTRTIDLPFAFETVDVFGFAFIAQGRIVAFFGALGIAALLWLLMTRTDLGKAIRAVAQEPVGARLVGIRVDHVYAVSFGIGTACVAAAACLLLPSFYVTPQVGNAFVLIAFTIVVLGGMGSYLGALVGGFIVGIVEALGGLWLGETLGQLGIFGLFIVFLMLRPQGLFGRRAT